MQRKRLICTQNTLSNMLVFCCWNFLKISWKLHFYDVKIFLKGSFSYLMHFSPYEDSLQNIQAVNLFLIWNMWAMLDSAISCFNKQRQAIQMLLWYVLSCYINESVVFAVIYLKHASVFAIHSETARLWEGKIAQMKYIYSLSAMLVFS